MDAETKRVLFVGLTSLDIINICDRYPAEDEDMKATKQYWQKGGNAANSAHVMSQFDDIHVSIMSSLSQGYEGTCVKNELVQNGIDISSCIFHENVGLPTSCCILSQETGYRTIVHCRNGLPELTHKDFESKVDFNQFDWVHFEGRGFPDVMSMVKSTSDFRNKNGSPKISLEIEKPKYLKQLSSDVLNCVDVIFVSKDVAQSMHYKNARETVLNFKNDMKLKTSVTLICPWGDLGADAVWDLDEYCHCDAFKPSQVVDTLGAGDTFIAGAIHSLMKTKPIETCLKAGCELAGRKCAQIGYNDLVTRQ